MEDREGDGAYIFVSKGIADADRIGKKGRTEGGKGRPSKSEGDRPTQNFGFVMLKPTGSSAERDSFHLRGMHACLTRQKAIEKATRYRGG